MNQELLLSSFLSKQVKGGGVDGIEGKGESD